jgi:hypothetical protein
MNEEQMPGANSSDRDVRRRWREASMEEPSSLVDARIRAAARQALASDHLQSRGRRSSRWGRYVPLAAAASVALLAVGLVRLIPREEYQALPGRNVTRGDEVRRAAPPPSDQPALPAERAQPPEPEIEPPRTQPFAVGPPAIQVDRTQRAAELMSRQERARPPEPERAPVEPPATTPRDRESAPAGLDSAAKTVVTTAVPSSPETLARTIPETLAEQVRTDAARRTGADAASIRIVAVEPAVWPVASLGCAPESEQAGKHLEGARVPGYMVTVEAPETTLRYHTDEGDRIVVCESE